MREPINNSKEIPQKTSLQNNSKLINGFNENNINSENNNYSNNCQNNTKFSFKESGSNPAKQTRRPLTAQQKSPYISNFWISTLKSRSSSEALSSQRLLLGHNATEKLQQLQQQSPSSQSLSSLSSPSSSAINNLNSEDQQINNVKNNLENNLGTVESVAVRTANFLLEMRKTQEGKKQQSTKTNNNSPFSYNNTCGRITPFPSLLIDQQLPATTSSTSQLLLDSESESLDNNTKNCGRFPTIPSEKHQFHPLQVNINEEADKSSSSSLLQKQSSPTFSLSSSIAELPQPAPKHHLREQLLKIKQKNVFAGNSFFGGISNNPFFFGNQKQQKQRKILPTAKQLLHSSSPNFPQTNTVISRVNELEERQQKNKKNNTVAKPFGIAVQQQQNINSSQLLQANSTQNSSSKIKSANNSVTRNDRLSPRSSLFRTKPVIVVDLGQEEINEVKIKEEEIKQNKEEEKLKQKLIKYFEEEEDKEKQKLKLNNFDEKHQNISKTSSEIKEKSKSVTALVKQNVMPKHFQFNILKVSKCLCVLIFKNFKQKYIFAFYLH